MVTTDYQTSEKIWMFAKRMEPHLIRNQADMEKLMKMLILHDSVRARTAGAGADTQNTQSGMQGQPLSHHEVKALWNEFERKESYEARVAHAMLNLLEQVHF
ncbi:HD domain-containing protein [Brevibacillus nitrificans]|nr:HD domain-containing protein [Brevibacillus nitrificans]